MKIENDRLFVVDDRGQLSVYQLEQKKCERLEQSTVTQGLLLSVSVRQGQIATSSSVGSISVNKYYVNFYSKLNNFIW